MVNVAYNPKFVKKWDKNLVQFEETPVVEGKKSFFKTYLLNKKKLAFSGRDFCEKTFNFYSNGKFYRYSTSVDNTELPGPIGEAPEKESPQDIIRGFTIFSCAMLER